MNLCSILVMSCDKNQQLLSLFLDFLNKYWADCPYPIYVCLEKKKIQRNKTNVINSPKKYWGGRLLDSIGYIDSKYILLMLDDYLCENPVITDKVQKYIDILENNPELACVTLANIPDSKNIPCDCSDLVYRPQRGKYLVNTQVSIWRKDLLQKVVWPKDTPWQTELYGSIRARKFNNYTYVCLTSDKFMPIKYNRGWLVVRGKWNSDEISRLGLWNRPEIHDGKPIEPIGTSLIKLSLMEKIKFRVGVKTRIFLSYLNIFI